MKLSSCNVELTPSQVWEVVNKFNEDPWPYTPTGANPPLPVIKRVTTWEDAVVTTKPLWYPCNNPNGIDKDAVLCDVNQCKLNVPSKEAAESVLAYAKLLVVANALNREQVHEDDYAWTITQNLQVSQVIKTTTSMLIRFKSHALASHCLKYFHQLWLDYYML